MKTLSFLLLLVVLFGCTSEPSDCEIIRSASDVPKHVKHLHKALQEETSDQLEIIELKACSEQYRELEEKYNMNQVTAVFEVSNKDRKSTVANLLIFRSTHEAKKEFKHLTEQLSLTREEMAERGIKRDKKYYFSSERYKPGEFIFRYKNGIYQLPTTCSVSEENWKLFLNDVTSAALPENKGIEYLYLRCGTSTYLLETTAVVTLKEKQN